MHNFQPAVLVMVLHRSETCPFGGNLAYSCFALLLSHAVYCFSLSEWYFNTKSSKTDEKRNVSWCIRKLWNTPNLHICQSCWMGSPDNNALTRLARKMFRNLVICRTSTRTKPRTFFVVLFCLGDRMTLPYYACCYGTLYVTLEETIFLTFYCRLISLTNTNKRLL